MTTISIPKGLRGGFPKPIDVSAANGDPSDYATHQTLAFACLVLGCRRRNAIPGGGYRVLYALKITDYIAPFVARRESFSRTWRLSGYYKTDFESGVAQVTAEITNPTRTAKTIQLPFTGGVEREFVMDFDAGGGAESDEGVVEGYVRFKILSWVPADEYPTLTILGYTFDPEEAEQIEVT